MSDGHGGSKLSPEGRRRLGGLVPEATRKVTELAELEFSTVDEVPVERWEVLSEAREGISELSWIRWAVQVALENSDAVEVPPGQPEEALQ